MNPRLVEISSGSFSATVPVVHDLNPLILTLIVTDPDPASAFRMTSDALIEALAPEKREEFETLQVSAVIPLMTEWIRKSRELVEGVVL